MSIIDIITLIIALITCFFGYKLNKGLIAVIGLIIGFQISSTYLPAIIESQNLVYILSIIIALILGMLSYKLYLVGIFFLCAISAYLLFENLNLTGNIQIIFGLIIGVIAGILGVKFTRPLIIISTSLCGSSLIINTIMPALNIQNNTVNLILTLIIAIISMAYQFKQKDIN